MVVIVDLVRFIDEAPFGRFHRRIVAIGLLVLFIEGIDIQIIGFAAPSIIREWGVATADFGVVFSAGLLGATIGAAVLGPLGDRIGRKPLIVIATIFFGLGTIATPMAMSIDWLITIRFVASIGLGGVIPNMLALVSEFAPKRSRATIVAIVATGQLAGGMIGGFTSSWIIEYYGWRVIFYGAGLLSIVLAPVILSTVPESLQFLSRKRRHAPAMQATMRAIGMENVANVSFEGGARDAPPPRQLPITAILARDVRSITLCLWVAIAANLFMTAFVIYWLPTLLERLGMSLRDAIFAVSLMNGTGIIGGIVVARALDRFKPLTVMIFIYAGAALSVGSIGFVAPASIPVMVVTGLAGFFGLGGYAGVNVLAATAYPTLLRSSGIGWAIAMGKVGSILGPMAATAGLATGMPISSVFLISASGGVVAAVSLLWLRSLRSYPGYVDDTPNTLDDGRTYHV